MQQLTYLKSNIYRDISVQATGDDSQATFEQSNTNQETARSKITVAGRMLNIRKLQHRIINKSHQSQF